MHRSLAILVILLAGAPAARAADCPSGVRVNRRCVGAEVLRSLEKRYGFRSQPGAYWYDARSGLFGRIGQPALAAGIAGLPLPGPLPSDASGGDTRVFIN